MKRSYHTRISEELKINNSRKDVLGFRSMYDRKRINLNVGGIWDVSKKFNNFVRLLDKVYLVELICEAYLQENDTLVPLCKEKTKFKCDCPIIELFKKMKKRSWNGRKKKRQNPKKS